MHEFLLPFHIQGGFTTRSDYARTSAESIAKAAVLGLITTQLPDGSFGNVWRLTVAGLEVLHTLKPSSE